MKSEPRLLLRKVEGLTREQPTVDLGPNWFIGKENLIAFLGLAEPRCLSRIVASVP